MTLRTKAVTALCAPVWLLSLLTGWEWMTEEWFYGHGPRWWHALRGDQREEGYVDV